MAMLCLGLALAIGAVAGLIALVWWSGGVALSASLPQLDDEAQLASWRVHQLVSRAFTDMLDAAREESKQEIQR